MTVYFIRSGDSNMVKIGYTSSDDPTSRLRNLQTGSPVRLTIMGYIPNAGTDIENLLHIMLREYRLEGEWFMFDKAVFDKLKGYITFNNSIIDELNTNPSENFEIKLKKINQETSDFMLDFKAEQRELYNKKHTVDVERLKDKHTVDVERLKDKFTVDVERLKDKFTVDVERLNARFTINISELRKDQLKMRQAFKNKTEKQRRDYVSRRLDSYLSIKPIDKDIQVEALTNLSNFGMLYICFNSFSMLVMILAVTISGYDSDIHNGLFIYALVTHGIPFSLLGFTEIIRDLKLAVGKYL